MAAVFGMPCPIALPSNRSRVWALERDGGVNGPWCGALAGSSDASDRIVDRLAVIGDPGGAALLSLIALGRRALLVL